MPLAGALRKLLHEDKVIGDVKMVKADYSAALWGCKSYNPRTAIDEQGIDQKQISLTHIGPLGSKTLEVAGWTWVSTSFSQLF